jgi:hypothetical protein
MSSSLRSLRFHSQWGRGVIITLMIGKSRGLICRSTRTMLTIVFRCLCRVSTITSFNRMRRRLKKRRRRSKRRQRSPKMGKSPKRKRNNPKMNSLTLTFLTGMVLRRSQLRLKTRQKKRSRPNKSPRKRITNQQKTTNSNKN